MRKSFVHSPRGPKSFAPLVHHHRESEPERVDCEPARAFGVPQPTDSGDDARIRIRCGARTACSGVVAASTLPQTRVDDTFAPLHVPFVYKFLPFFLTHKFF